MRKDKERAVRLRLLRQQNEVLLEVIDSALKAFDEKHRLTILEAGKRLIQRYADQDKGSKP